MMTSPAHTCDIDDELALTLEGMNRHGIRRIPVLEDGHPIGLLVLDDILHHVSGELVEISYEARSRRDHPTSQEAPPGANQREHLLKDLDERLDELRAKLRERQLARAGGLPGRVGRCEVTPAPGPAHGHLRASGHPGRALEKKVAVAAAGLPPAGAATAILMCVGFPGLANHP